MQVNFLINKYKIYRRLIKLPDQAIVTICMYQRVSGVDILIGQTEIDIEDRFFNKAYA